MGATLRDVLNLVGLGAVYFGVLLGVLSPASFVSGWTNFQVEDSALYVGFARCLAEQGILHDSPDVDEYVRARMPMYPLIYLALGQFANLTGIDRGALATGTNICFVLAATILIYAALIRFLHDRAIAFASAATLILMPGIAPYVFAHMPESLTLFLWSGSAYCLSLRNRSLAPWIAGLLAGAATLTKPISLVAALPLIPILWFMGSERRPRRPVLFAFGFAPLPMLWLVRNWVLWGTVVMTPNSGTHLYDFLRTMLLQAQGRASVERHPLTNAPYDARLPATTTEWKAKFGFDFENFGRRTVLLGQLAKQEILADPMGYATLILARQPRLYLGAGTQALYTMSFADPNAARSAVRQPDWLWRSGWWTYQLASAILMALIYGLTILGAWKGLQDRRLRTATLVCIVMLLVQAAVVGPFGHTRYRFLMTPFFAVLAAVGFVKLRSRQHEIVPMDDLLPARSGEQVRQLPGRSSHDASSLFGRIVR
jgi:4-amino-4-deoxy-L-arabinose transferase-like glycosyltransferase